MKAQTRPGGRQPPVPNMNTVAQFKTGRSTAPDWYYDLAHTADEISSKLDGRGEGAFAVCPDTNPKLFVLAVKVRNHVEIYQIARTTRGYKLDRGAKAFGSLSELVYYYADPKTIAGELPVPLNIQQLSPTKESAARPASRISTRPSSRPPSNGPPFSGDALIASRWSAEDVAVWLDAMGLGQHRHYLRYINGFHLLNMDRNAFLDLGIDNPDELVAAVGSLRVLGGGQGPAPRISNRSAPPVRSAQSVQHMRRQEHRWADNNSGQWDPLLSSWPDMPQKKSARRTRQAPGRRHRFAVQQRKGIVRIVDLTTKEVVHVYSAKYSKYLMKMGLHGGNAKSIVADQIAKLNYDPDLAEDVESAVLKYRPNYASESEDDNAEEESRAGVPHIPRKSSKVKLNVKYRGDIQNDISTKKDENGKAGEKTNMEDASNETHHYHHHYHHEVGNKGTNGVQIASVAASSEIVGDISTAVKENDSNAASNGQSSHRPSTQTVAPQVVGSKDPKQPAVHESSADQRRKQLAEWVKAHNYGSKTPEELFEDLFIGSKDVGRTNAPLIVGQHHAMEYANSVMNGAHLRQAAPITLDPRSTSTQTKRIGRNPQHNKDSGIWQHAPRPGHGLQQPRVGYGLETQESPVKQGRDSRHKLLWPESPVHAFASPVGSQQQSMYMSREEPRFGRVPTPQQEANLPILSQSHTNTGSNNIGTHPPRKQDVSLQYTRQGNLQNESMNGPQYQLRRSKVQFGEVTHHPEAGPSPDRDGEPSYLQPDNDASYFENVDPTGSANLTKYSPRKHAPLDGLGSQLKAKSTPNISPDSGVSGGEFASPAVNLEPTTPFRTPGFGHQSVGYLMPDPPATEFVPMSEKASLWRLGGNRPADESPSNAANFQPKSPDSQLNASDVGYLPMSTQSEVDLEAHFAGSKDGEYLIQQSQISVVANGQVHTVPVLQDGMFIKLDKSKVRFKNMAQLVEYYQHSDHFDEAERKNEAPDLPIPLANVQWDVI